MKIAGTLEIGAPAATVWEAVIDPTDLAACVPGVGDVRQLDERTFEGTIRASVGPIDGTFAFRSVIVRADFPADLVVDVEGVDSVTGSRLVAHVEAFLTEPAPGRTVLVYRATVSVKGRLAIIGEMVLRATASVVIGQVTKCLRSRLEADRA